MKTALSFISIITLVSIISEPSAVNAQSIPNKSVISPTVLTEIQGLFPTKSMLMGSKVGFGKLSYGMSKKELKLPNYAAVKAWASRPNISPAVLKLLDSIPVEIDATVSLKKSSAVGDPTATGDLTGRDIIGIPLWNFSVTQSFYDNGKDVTYVQSPNSQPVAYYPGWSASNATDYVSSPIPYWIVTSYNQAIFTYTPIDLTSVETQVANIDFSFDGDGGFVPSMYITTG